MFEPKCLDEFPNLKAFMCRFEVMMLPTPFSHRHTHRLPGAPGAPLWWVLPTPAFPQGIRGWAPPDLPALGRVRLLYPKGGGAGQRRVPLVRQGLAVLASEPGVLPRRLWRRSRPTCSPTASSRCPSTTRWPCGAAREYAEQGAASLRLFHPFPSPGDPCAFSAPLNK